MSEATSPPSNPLAETEHPNAVPGNCDAKERNIVILVVGTRIHLGEAARISEHLEEQVRQFCGRVQEMATYFQQPSIAVHGVIAVDAEARKTTVDGEAMDLVAAVQSHCRLSSNDPSTVVDVLPVQPWGKFVPALNALVTYAARTVQNAPNPSRGALLLVSLETNVAPASVQVLLSHLKDADTLVCGAVLPGHEYDGPSNGEPAVVTLNGLTSPWNTLALWNVAKLALTGFLAVSEGLHDDDGPAIAGIEEVACIATLQKLVSPSTMKAKLMALPSVQWDTTSFAPDPARQAWHAKKMASKRSRAAQQLALLQNPNGGIVHHY